MRFADHQKQGLLLEDGLYEAVIISVQLTSDENGNPKISQGGLPLIDVKFEIDGGDTVVERSRRCSTSLQQNRANRVWSVLAQIIKAATGMPYGQHQEVTSEDLIGKRLKVKTEVTPDGFMNLVAFFPTKNVATQTRPQAQQSRPTPPSRDDAPISQPLDEIPEDEIPF